MSSSLGEAGVWTLDHLALRIPDIDGPDLVPVCAFLITALSFKMKLPKHYSLFMFKNLFQNFGARGLLQDLGMFRNSHM